VYIFRLQFYRLQFARSSTRLRSAGRCRGGSLAARAAPAGPLPRGPARRGGRLPRAERRGRRGGGGGGGDGQQQRRTAWAPLHLSPVNVSARVEREASTSDTNGHGTERPRNTGLQFTCEEHTKRAIRKRAREEYRQHMEVREGRVSSACAAQEGSVRSRARRKQE